jgi:uncharacterized protein YggT (Ycf19 family)
MTQSKKQMIINLLSNVKDSDRNVIVKELIKLTEPCLSLIDKNYEIVAQV